MIKGFEHKAKNGVEYLSVKSFQDTGAVTDFFSTRIGGKSKGDLSSLNLGFNRGDLRENVEANFHTVADIMGVDYNKLVLSAQTHTDNVVSVTRQDAGKGIIKEGYTDVDGLVTNIPGLTLVTFYADCTPLMFVDPVKCVIAMAHSGWKGTVKKIGKVTVEKMVREYGCNPGNILAAIGPGAGPCCYEVDDDLAVTMMRTGNSGDCAVYNPATKKLHADLWRTNYNILIEAGIPDGNITVAGECTICNPYLYYSNRVQGKYRGSMAAFLSLKKGAKNIW